MSYFRKLGEWARSNELLIGFLAAAAVGVLAAVGQIGFSWLMDVAQRFFFQDGARLLSGLGRFYVLVIPVVGGLIVGLFVQYGAREAKGHGVPEVMEAVAIRGGRIRPRVAFIKALASAVCIGSGGSVGREGPIVQIGSSLGSTVGQVLRLPENWIRTLVACGAAGGISATFNAPIGGVLFAMEIILGWSTGPRLGFVVISSVVASAISRGFLGAEPAFGIIQYEMTSNWELLTYGVLGVVAALGAVAFTKTLYFTEDRFDAWRIPEWLKPAVGGLLLGLVGLYSLDLFGVGYGEAQWATRFGIDEALASSVPLASLLILCVLKIVASSVTLGSGGSGGIFAPSLFIGAMLGGAVGTIAHHFFPDITAPAGAYALVGMAAVFTGAARAPVTSIIMLFEMTLDYRVILPLMIAVVVSLIVSRRLSRESIYTLKLRRRGVDISHLEHVGPLREVRVADIMRTDFPVVDPGLSVEKLMAMLRQGEQNGFPVVSEDGEFQGIVTLADVQAAMSQGNFARLTVNDIATKSPIVAYPRDTLHDVFMRLAGTDVGRIPVVDRNNSRRLVGVLRREDILRAYAMVVAGKPPRAVARRVP